MCHILHKINKRMIDHVLLFCKLGTFTALAYYVLLSILNFTSYKFRTITPQHKKMYVVKNYVKSAYLLFLMCAYFDKIVGIMLSNNYDEHNMNVLKECAIIYVINDFLGLLLVKLPRSTQFHHIATNCIAISFVLKTTNNLDVCILAVYYAFFSSMAYLVNAFLGLRVYYENNKVMKYIVLMNIIVYSSTSVINWVCQIYLMTIIDIDVSYMLYTLFLCVVMYDDVVLIKWLISHYDSYIINQTFGK